MGRHCIRRGLTLPIAGGPRQSIEGVFQPSRVALLAEDSVGLRPAFHVAVGDRVRRGQLLFEDKKVPGVRYTSPGAGIVVAIHRGERRAFQSLVVALSASERAGEPDESELTRFESYHGTSPGEVGRDEVKALLLESGLWTALRARPFGRVADPRCVPNSIFVTAIDTNPHAPSVRVAIEGREGDFEAGLRCVSTLSNGPTFLCTAPGSRLSAPAGTRVRVEEFEGPHPAGTVGVHIHRLDPVSRHKVVWHLQYQDVAAIGRLATTGRLDVERVIALAGPAVTNPRLLRTRLGASLDELVAGELREGENRVVSGSVLAGRGAMGDVLGYLGRYHVQVAVLPEGRDRPFMSWVMPGTRRFSAVRAFLSAFLPRREHAFTTSTNGSLRAIVPIGVYERVMPMDIPPTHLLRSLVARDVERAEQLGCLELEEEDLALCAFVCPGKIDYGPILRENLAVLEKEG